MRFANEPPSTQRAPKDVDVETSSLKCLFFGSNKRLALFLFEGSIPGACRPVKGDVSRISHFCHFDGPTQGIEIYMS